MPDATVAEGEESPNEVRYAALNRLDAREAAHIPRHDARAVIDGYNTWLEIFKIFDRRNLQDLKSNRYVSTSRLFTELVDEAIAEGESYDVGSFTVSLATRAAEAAVAGDYTVADSILDLFGEQPGKQDINILEVLKDQIPFAKGLIRIFADGGRFLAQPSEEAFGRVQEHSISLSDLYDYYGSRSSKEFQLVPPEGDNITLNGVEVIEFANLFNNAVDHGKQVKGEAYATAKIDRRNGGLVMKVSNFSDKPWDDSNFESGVTRHKPEGKVSLDRGSGLFIAKTLADLVGYDLTGASSYDKAKAAHRIELVYAPKRAT